MLKKLQYTTKTDDLFDQYTGAVLLAFQKDYGLLQDAVYTTEVGNVMEKAIAFKENMKIDQIPKKSSNMYRLAKFIDTTNIDLIEELRNEGYILIETPE